MSPEARPAAASSLLARLLSPDSSLPLAEVARTRLSVHYETGRDDVPVLCVCTPDAVRLPPGLVTTVLPTGTARVRSGVLETGSRRWPVTRWWRPARLHGMAPPAGVPDVDGVDVPDSVEPAALLGRGPGLTPAGDDVLAGALVTAHAVGDPRLTGWRRQTRAALAGGATTAVSRALLQHAADGWAVPQLAAFVAAACAGDPTPAVGPLLAVGHTSGAALAGGALHVLGTAAGVRRAA